MGRQSLTRDWTHHKLQVYNDVEALEDILGVTLPAIPDPGLSAAKVRNNFENSFGTQCIAVLLRDSGKVYLTVNKYHEESYPLIDKYLTRSLYIRKMADKVSRVMCDGKPFVSLHWRSMVERCPHMTFPLSNTCVSYLLLNKRRDKIVNVTYDFVISQDIQCMYISAPPSQTKMVDLFRNTGLRIIDSNSLHNTSTYGKDIRVFVEDPYKMSLLEQEISVNAAIFIKNRWSNWSEFVEYTRTAQNKKTHTYEDIPGTPYDVLSGYRIVKK
ncbi:uncharacterized protein LOC144356520 [Saccoglossus kowalevskii]